MDLRTLVFRMLLGVGAFELDFSHVGGLSKPGSIHYPNPPSIRALLFLCLDNWGDCLQFSYGNQKYSKPRNLTNDENGPDLVGH
jgi:hypothetical protein